jgi:hypothetical protein
VADRALRRRVSGPLDRTAFRPRRVSLHSGERSSELARLSLYRIGLAGTHSKYRIVPRSAIVDYEQLCEAVHARPGTGDLRGFLIGLWQRHGAASRTIIDSFVAAAGELDRRGSDISPDELEAILAGPCSLAGLNHGRVGDLGDAGRQLLEAWLRACSPPSAAARLRENAELAVCFVLRRTRQYASVAMIRAGRRRDGGSRSEPADRGGRGLAR